MKFETVKLVQKDCFNLKDIFECGQCFRWTQEEDGSYTGIVKIGVLNISYIKDEIMVKGYVEDKTSLKEFVIDYLDLNKDYKNIQKEISSNDSVMKDAIRFGNGIRILNQDSWEMLISFIISAANNIPRISKCINNISKEYGKKVVIPQDIQNKLFKFGKKENTFYLFPSAKELSKATMEELRDCNLGFRDKYVLKSAQLVSNKKINLNEIEELEYKTAKKELMNIDGVGSKVADCILLFSMKKSEAFPVDTWIKKIMNEIYIDSQNVKKINDYAYKKWGLNSGIAQQYLFNYMRNKS